MENHIIQPLGNRGRSLRKKIFHISKIFTVSYLFLFPDGNSDAINRYIKIHLSLLYISVFVLILNFKQKGRNNYCICFETKKIKNSSDVMQ